MFAKTLGAAVVGLNGVLITVEVDISNGIPAFEIVGLPDAAVRESKERVKAAIRNTGFDFPCRRITVNLAPADLKKDGSGLDLPIALGILAAGGLLENLDLSRVVSIGELSLDGYIRGIAGALPMAIACRQEGIGQLYISAGNAAEVSLVDGVDIRVSDSLADTVKALLAGDASDLPHPMLTTVQQSFNLDDFADVQGQYGAKRALEIAAAGGHNVLMTGPPGSGKTMLARRIPSILPAMTQAEALEVTKIYSVAGILGNAGGLMSERPFRAPHHTVSAAAMSGGGSIPKPGEVTLAHHGVLFLDELPEFPRHVLEVLRQPVEDGQVLVARVNSSCVYPAKFMLISAMNPCPCGFFTDPEHQCTCSPQEIRRYLRRISGPLMDRIDMHVNVPRIKYEDMVSVGASENSATIALRVAAARTCQQQRFAREGIFCNAQMSHRQIRIYAMMTDEAGQLLKNVFEKMKLNARAYDRLIKVARTIADLAGREGIDAVHMAEAAQLRLSVLEAG